MTVAQTWLAEKGFGLTLEPQETSDETRLAAGFLQVNPFLFLV